MNLYVQFLIFLNSYGIPAAVAQGIIWGIMAIGLYITYKILEVSDLTVDGSFATGGAVFVVCITSGMHIALAMTLAFFAGCLAGLITGIFHTKFGIPAILSGILTQLMLYSINLRIMSQSSNLPVGRKYALLLSLGQPFGAMSVAAFFAFVIIVVLYWFFGTELGHSLRATGCNNNMARANGINTDTNKIIGLVISNGIVALSGALLSQFQGFADINMGRGAIVIGLAAIIIGEVIFGKIFKNFALRLVSVAIGGVIYYIIVSFVLRFKIVEANDLKLGSALIVAIFLAVPYWKGKLAEMKIAKGDA